MKIINKLTLRHLKENKGRTIVTTLGIIISVAMITAVFVALASFMNLIGEIDIMSSGRFHSSLECNSSQLQALKEDDRIAEVGISSMGDYKSSFQLEKRKSNPLGTGSFCAGDATYVKQMITGNYDGTLPSRKGEIAVEQRMIEKNNLGWKIGDRVKIPTGVRYDESEGELYEVSGSYDGKEIFNETKTEEFVITAILHSNPATTSFPIILCSVDEHTVFREDDCTDATIVLKNVNYKSLDEIKAIANENGIENYSYKATYLQTNLAIDGEDITIISLASIALVVLILIMIASVVLIYNAFAMSISERVRYLGMLASVGATKKQKRLSVYFESFVLGAIGIPVGIASGIIGIGITLKAIGDKIINSGMISGIDSNSIDMRVIVPLWAIIGIILISSFTIFVSAYIPSKKASKITPIDAIRQTSEVKVKARRLRSSKLVRLIFGYEGELANKNLKRNGRKARVITASIALSIILFISCNYFCSIFTQSVQLEDEIPYQLTLMFSYENKDDIEKQLSEISDIDDFYCITNAGISIDIASINEYELTNPDNLESASKSITENGIYIQLNVLDDDRFNALCSANGIDSRDYYKAESKALLMNSISHRKGDKAFNNNIIGTDLKNLFNEAFDETTIGGLVEYDEDFYACGLSPRNTISLFMPYSSYIECRSNYVESDPDIAEMSFNATIGIVTDKHKEVYDAIHDFLCSGEFGWYSINDNVEAKQAMNAVSFVIQVLVYGFIALITLITIFNIINTISTGVALRKKEFAMLKSVGTTPKGFNKMIMLESAFYGLKAIIFALPISIGISFLMYQLLDIYTLKFEINWLLYLAVTAVVFVIIGATMLYSVHKLRNDSIVETLKEEIN